MSDVEPPSRDLPGFLMRRPSLQYFLLSALGALGIYVSMPIALGPQTTIEWVDLIINLLILIPSAVLAVGGGALTVVSAISPSTLGDESRSARFTRIILRTIGIPRAIIPDIATLGPLGLFIQLFWPESRERSLPSTTESEEGSD